MNHTDEMPKTRIYRHSVFHKDVLDGCLLNEILEDKIINDIKLSRYSKKKESLNRREHVLARANIVEERWVHSIVGSDLGQEIKLTII